MSAPVEDLRERLERAWTTGEPLEFDHHCDDDQAPAEGATLVEVPGNQLSEILQRSDGHRRGLQLHGARVTGGLNLAWADLPRPLALRCCVIEDGLDLADATATTLDIDRCWLGNVDLSDVRITHNVFITSTQATGLDATRSQTTGNLNLNNLTSTGTVHLNSAKIGGQLSMTGAELDAGPERTALNAQNIDVTGDVFLSEGFKATGTVHLPGTKIGGQLSMYGAELDTGPERTALDAQSIDVTESVLLNGGFKAVGTVDLNSAKIGGDLILVEAGLSASERLPVEHERAALRMPSATVGGTLHLRELGSAGEDQPGYGSVDVSGARVGVLWDDESAWPVGRARWLDGFVYDRLHAQAPRTAAMRLAWVRAQSTPALPATSPARQTASTWLRKPFQTLPARATGRQATGHGRAGFLPQPYLQVAAALDAAGLGDEATEVRKALVEDEARASGPLAVARAWFGRFIGHGYNPWRPLWPLAALLTTTWVILQYFGLPLMVPTGDQAPTTPTTPTVQAVQSVQDTPDQQEHPALVRADKCRDLAQDVDSYPCPSVLAYAIETVVPLIDLHQAAYWQPANRTWPERWLGGWLRFATLGGWICSTFAAAGLAGSIKNQT